MAVPTLPPEKVPRRSFLLKHYSSFHFLLRSYHVPSCISCERTGKSALEGSKEASKSATRKRHTCRLVPPRANPFTLPLRTQSSSVRVLTRRCAAASSAVSQFDVFMV